MQIWVDSSFKDGDVGIGILVRKLIPGGIKEVKIRLRTTAKDNNHAELLGIYHALKRLRVNEKIYIITDSMTAIKSILYKPPEKYKDVANKIKDMLSGMDWKIYHKAGHSKSNDRYSQRQNITDKLAKNARELTSQKYRV